MARLRREKKKSGMVMIILAGIMLFGTIAGAFLFQNPQPTEFPPINPPLETAAPQVSTVTLRHNPVDSTTITGRGFQTISHDDTTIYIDPNNPLANRTLAFDIELVNISKANYTGDASSMTASEGDTVVAFYTGRLKSGEVFDTAYTGIARNATIPKVAWFRERPFYEPLEFIVGAGMMIEGFDEAVIGMKINETKKVNITPDKAYGFYNSSLVQEIPIAEEIPKTMEIRRFMELTNEDFMTNFGTANITMGETINVPGTSFNASIFYTTENMTVIEMLLKPGQIIKLEGSPWDSTVVSVGQGSIIIEHNLKSGDTIQFPGMPWNTTVQ